MLRSFLLLFVLTFGLAGCVFDVGADPSTPSETTGGDEDASLEDAAPDVPTLGDTHSGGQSDGAEVTVAEAGPTPDTVSPPDGSPIDDGAATDPTEDGGPSGDVIDKADTPKSDSGPTTGADGGGPGDDTGSAPDTAAPAGPLPASALWPVTFTTTLTGDGLTLQPLGSRHGFTGVLSAPDGSLRLEALP